MLFSTFRFHKEKATRRYLNLKNRNFRLLEICVALQNPFNMPYIDLTFSLDYIFFIQTGTAISALYLTLSMRKPFRYYILRFIFNVFKNHAAFQLNHSKIVIQFQIVLFLPFIVYMYKQLSYYWEGVFS